MQSTQGTLGRLFVLKFDNNDIFLDELQVFIKKQKIKTAALVFIGALRQGRLVTGPKKPVIPPKPNWKTFKDGWEVMGLGTVFTNPTGPQIHIHTAMGKKDKTLTGCLRKAAKVFLVVEAVLFELKNVKADKNLDPRTGLNLLRILA